MGGQRQDGKALGQGSELLEVPTGETGGRFSWRNCPVLRSKVTQRSSSPGVGLHRGDKGLRDGEAHRLGRCVAELGCPLQLKQELPAGEHGSQ